MIILIVQFIIIFIIGWLITLVLLDICKISWPPCIYSLIWIVVTVLAVCVLFLFWLFDASSYLSACLSTIANITILGWKVYTLYSGAAVKFWWETWKLR